MAAPLVDLAPFPNALPTESNTTEGYVTGASKRDWAGHGALMNLTGCGEIERALLTDPQTSGGYW